MMQQVNQEFDDLVEVSENLSTSEIAVEGDNSEDAIVYEQEDEKTLTEKVCALEDDQAKNPDEKQKETVVSLLKELQKENKEILEVIKEIQNEKIVYEKYQQNLNDFKDTFEIFQTQLPQLILQLRTDLKTGPGTDYRKIIEEAAENYKNLKKAIANDINKAIETWDKVRESKKEQRIERFLLFIVMMQAAITIKILWDYFIGV